MIIQRGLRVAEAIVDVAKLAPELLHEPAIPAPPRFAQGDERRGCAPGRNKCDDKEQQVQEVLPQIVRWNMFDGTFDRSFDGSFD